MAARRRADRRRQRGARSLFALGGEHCRRLVGFEGAERRDARQDEAPRAARRKQRLRQRLSGALRRHIDRRVGQRRRSARAGEVLNQDAVQERAAQGGQKRRAGGNREDFGAGERACAPFMRRAGEGKSRRRTFNDREARSPGKRAREPPPRALIARNPEPQPVGSVGERPGEDARREQPLKRGARVGFRREAEQAGPADDAPAIALEQRVEPPRLLRRGDRASRPSRRGRRALLFRSRSPDR